MNVHLQVSDDQKRALTLDGDLDLLDQLIATIRATRNYDPNLVVAATPKPSGSRIPKPMAMAVPKSVNPTPPEPEALAAHKPQQSEAPDDLSPLAKCYLIAAARGRALRLAREQASKNAIEDSDHAAPQICVEE